MYLYFDSNGVLKEIINDKPFRQGNVDVNKIYIYVENTEINSLWIKYKNIDGTEAPDTGWYQLEYDEPTEMQIPYNPRRDLKYFKYYTDYPMYEVPLEGDDAEWSALNYAGTVALTMRIDGTDTLGLVVFNVEESVEGNYIAPDEYISLAQFNYLLSKFSGIDYNVYDSELNKDSINAVQNKVLYKSIVERNLGGSGPVDILKRNGKSVILNADVNGLVNSVYFITITKNGNNYDYTIKSLTDERYYKATNKVPEAPIAAWITPENLSDENPFRDKLYHHVLFLSEGSPYRYYLEFDSNHRQAITNTDNVSLLSNSGYNLFKNPYLLVETIADSTVVKKKVFKVNLDTGDVLTSGYMINVLVITATGVSNERILLQTLSDTVTEV